MGQRNRWHPLFLALLLGAVPSFANLITNGSFETGAFSPNQWGWQTLFSNDPSIPGWNIGPGCVDYVGPYWTAAHGTRSIDLSGDGSQGTIWQIFPSTPGHTYRVTFALSGNVDAQPRTTRLRVWVDDPAVTYQDFDYVVNGQTHGNPGWIYLSWDFTASSSATKLGFTSLDTFNEMVWGRYWGYSFGPALDDVVVVDLIPEPGTLALAALGLLAVSGLVRRRLRRR